MFILHVPFRLLGACSIIVSTIIRKRVCSAEVHPIFMLSLADCLLSGLWISGSSIWLSDLNDKHYNSIYCYPITLLTGVCLYNEYMDDDA